MLFCYDMRGNKNSPCSLLTEQNDLILENLSSLWVILEYLVDVCLVSDACFDTYVLIYVFDARSESCNPYFFEKIAKYERKVYRRDFPWETV